MNINQNTECTIYDFDQDDKLCKSCKSYYQCKEKALTPVKIYTSENIIEANRIQLFLKKYNIKYFDCFTRNSTFSYQTRFQDHVYILIPAYQAKKAQKLLFEKTK